MLKYAPHTIPLVSGTICLLTEVLPLFREVLYAPNCQPFLIAGSGTLGWDQVRCRPVFSELCGWADACGVSLLCVCIYLDRVEPR